MALWHSLVLVLTSTTARMFVSADEISAALPAQDCEAAPKSIQLALVQRLHQLKRLAEEPLEEWEQDLIEDDQFGEGSSGGDSGAASGPAVTTPSIPAYQSQTCKTKADDRAVGVLTSVSAPGSACWFGVDPADEAEHCVPDEAYGSFGWCYTAADKSTWGVCSEDCPLFGPPAILGGELDSVKAATAELENISKSLGSE
mmetsp:Transcript_54262/g.129341  ORF Transcript_54262/g.129341 Transcript_54262/m.129341 type:complete len:200 (+) Transcript_54262:93-692(+)